MNEFPKDEQTQEERQWFMPDDLGLDIENSTADLGLYTKSHGDRRIAEFLLLERDLHTKSLSGEISETDYEDTKNHLHVKINQILGKIGLEPDYGP